MLRPAALILLFGASLLLLPATRTTEAEDTKAAPTDTLKTRFAKMAEQIQIAPAGRPRDLFDFNARPALSWSNPARQTTAGALYFWTESGRPQVALCIYPGSETVIDLEFQSLSDDALSADFADTLFWEPTGNALDWKSLASAQPPGRTRFARLRQMRLLARQFSSKLVPPNKNPIELRMLETPIYRYELGKQDAATPAADEGLVDGAIFAFVQGTDPEVLLLIEAEDRGGDPGWRYSLARMSIVPTQVHHQQTLVWETNWAFSKKPNSPYFVYQTF